MTKTMESANMSTNGAERGDVPLYVKVPATTQDYLNVIKEETGITKTDAVTLILEVARKFIDPVTLSEISNKYMLLGEDGLELSDICKNQ